MGEWRGAILDYILENYRDGGENSHLCEYLREQLQLEPRVRLKMEFALIRPDSEEDARKLLSSCIEVVLEQPDIGAYQSLKALVEGPKPGEGKRAYANRLRRDLSKVKDGRDVGDSAEIARSIATEVIENTHPKPSPKPKPASLALECLWDLEAGDRALGSEEGRREIERILRERLEQPPKGLVLSREFPDGKLTKDDLDEIVTQLVDHMAQRWLDNRGVSLSERDADRCDEWPGERDVSKKNVSRARDIPVDLVERCMNDPYLRYRLGLDERWSTSEITDEKNLKEDLAAFYRALLDGIVKGEDYSRIVVPVIIDSKTGAGLYILGEDFAKPSDAKTSKLVKKAFFRYGRYELYSEPFFKSVSRPFFAIMYHHWDMYECFESSNKDDVGLGDSDVLIRGLWDDVVNAWVPDVKRGGFDGAAKRAIGRFKAARKSRDVKRAYRIRNEYRPDLTAFPERFQVYFDPEDYGFMTK